MDGLYFSALSMYRRSWQILKGGLFALLILTFRQLPAQPAEPPPESVVVVANSTVTGSLKVARAYLKARDIPEKNLIVIESIEKEKIPREMFLTTIRNPILDALLERELISGIEGKTDAFGRKTVSVISNPIRYLVLCYGVPVHIPNKPPGEVDDLELREKHLTGNHRGLVQAFTEGPMAKNEASVDGELALLLRRDVPLNGFLPNPYFRNQTPGNVRDILRVTRLDGSSPQAVINMIRNTLEGEEKGLRGRAYVDEDGRGGNYQSGNQWLADTAGIFSALGFDLDHDTARRTFPPEHRFDEPVLYAGWYARNLDGPFSLPGFRFPPGAIAAHLHSYSAIPVRSESRGWVGPLVDRGVSATFGNTAEPYLRFTHQFDLFFAALGEGWNFGDAAYFAQPTLSWQNISIGDPLYRPFAVGLEAQWESIDDPMEILSNQYAVMRRINLLRAEGKREDALRIAARGMRHTPGPALGLTYATLLEEAGDTAKARQTLSFLANLDLSDWSQWGLFAEIADTLVRLGDAKSGLKIYQNLERQNIPEEPLMALLKRGIQVAEEAGEPGIAIDWRARTTPPPPENTPPTPAQTPEETPAP